jgi:hypothetical protein
VRVCMCTCMCTCMCMYVRVVCSCVCGGGVCAFRARFWGLAWLVAGFFFIHLTDLAELRKKFEEDKARIQRMKQARKFKP